MRMGKSLEGMVCEGWMKSWVCWAQSRAGCRQVSQRLQLFTGSGGHHSKRSVKVKHPLPCSAFWKLVEYMWSSVLSTSCLGSRQQVLANGKVGSCTGNWTAPLKLTFGILGSAEETSVHICSLHLYRYRVPHRAPMKNTLSANTGVNVNINTSLLGCLAVKGGSSCKAPSSPKRALWGH